uniref:tRNA (adenine(58)-N(1))-methyltransferase non-catalytic subunit TRM6 n=1 Tax=Panagrolaimus superbus TaxID=310955 RepID=A0A914YF75_9BILA
MEEVLSMKSSGASTSVIVSTLVQGNTNFSERTNYSKEKYVSKKAKHHSDQVYILAPTIRMIAQTIYRRNSETASFLRPDMLSSMLYYASIIGGSKVLVYDESCGLISAAVLQRLDGKGELYLLYKNLTFNSHEALQAMNFNPIETMPFRPIRLSNLAKVIVKETPLPPHGMPTVDTTTASTAVSAAPPKESFNYSDENLFAEVDIKEQLIWIHERILDRSFLDSIIIVSNAVSPLELLQHTFKSLRSSGTVVVYTVIQEEICEIYTFLEENGAINIQIQEQSNREMQILRDRCHPMLQTHVASGYLITAIKTV